MRGWLDPAEELRQANELRSRAHLLRQLGADGLARDLEAVAVISEQKARALSRINLPSDTVLSPRAQRQEQVIRGA
jgi:hypothetical protein